ncbi:MAG: caspase family protein [Salinivirgaceae bacterium]
MNRSTFIYEIAVKERPFEAFSARNSAKETLKNISLYIISLLFIILISINCPAQLVKAIKAGNMVEVDKLIAAGADVNEEYNKSPHNPPLYFAIKANNLDMTRLLLKSGADANQCCILYNAMNATSSCWRVIFYAVGTKNPEMVKLLIDYGADINVSDNHKFQTPLQVAQEGGLTEIVAVLKEAKNKSISNSTLSLNKQGSMVDEKQIKTTPSDVDIDIPIGSSSRPNTYALIIGNEDYSSYQTNLKAEVNVQFAENDARIFKEYCVKTLGIPDKNSILLINATGSKMLQNLDLISKISKATNGKAEIIFYYAGHGLPDEQTKEPYLVPVDVSGSDLKYAVSLAEVYKKLTENKAVKVTVFIDACFSGGARNESLVALRGVKIRPKEKVVGNNLLVFTSSSGDESSASYKDKQHGLFTYYLLKKLQDSQGNCSYEELEEYLKKEISLNSLLINKKQQTPQIIGSPDVLENWKGWRIK